MPAFAGGQEPLYGYIFNIKNCISRNHGFHSKSAIETNQSGRAGLFNKSSRATSGVVLAVTLHIRIVYDDKGSFQYSIANSKSD